MRAQSELLKWAEQASSHMPVLGARTRRSACQKLASDKTAQAVPFLVSALESSDDDVRSIAEEGLKSLSDPHAIDALFLGHLFTKSESLRQVLRSLGRSPPEASRPLGSHISEIGQEPSLAERAWRWENKRDGTILAFIPEGGFLAGKEGFDVHLPAYYLALGCVTNAQYARFLTERRPNCVKLDRWLNLPQSDAICQCADKFTTDPESADLPVVWVTWEGAVAYCKWAGLRLPSELEWEKGARGVDGRLYPWGDDWEAGRPLPAPGEQRGEEISSVWEYPTGRSPYGLYQMIGNVYEWCADWYDQSAYERYAQGDMQPPQHGEHRVVRGGPWRFGTLSYLRTEYRKSTVWRGGTLFCGFRCAKNL